MNLAQAIELVFRYGNVAAKSEEELLKHIVDATVTDSALRETEQRCHFAVEDAFYQIRKRLELRRQVNNPPPAQPAETSNGEEVTTATGMLAVVGHKAGMGVPNPAKREDGQNVDHWVLTQAERAKGFVEPVRNSYQHLKCGVVTRMGPSIAETYARNPKFYGSTFCCGCNQYLPVGEHGEFVWDGTDQKVGTMRESRHVLINGVECAVAPVMRAKEILAIARPAYAGYNLMFSNDRGLAGIIEDPQQFVYPRDGERYTDEKKKAT